jgi:hypothetical protein
MASISSKPFRVFDPQRISRNGEEYRIKSTFLQSGEFTMVHKLLKAENRLAMIPG